MISRLPMVNIIKVSHQIFLAILFLFALDIFNMPGNFDTGHCYRHYL